MRMVDKEVYEILYDQNLLILIININYDQLVLILNLILSNLIQQKCMFLLGGRDKKDVEDLIPILHS